MDDMPHIDLEFVDVNESLNSKDPSVVVSDDKTAVTTDYKPDETQDEFYFPLFATPVGQTSSKPNRTTQEANDDPNNETLESEAPSNVMKISIRDDYYESVENKRPSTYYFAQYNDNEKKQFREVSLSGQDVLNQVMVSGPVYDQTPWKCIDLAAYNKKIETQNLIERRKRRPGKKKRLQRLQCRERKIERARIEKKLEKERQAKERKKMFHKRGGKKHKKTGKSPSANEAQRPKYRTE